MQTEKSQLPEEVKEKIRNMINERFPVPESPKENYMDEFETKVKNLMGCYACCLTSIPSLALSIFLYLYLVSLQMHSALAVLISIPAFFGSVIILSIIGVLLGNYFYPKVYPDNG